jgi:2,4-dichlorophenol 6-monooxygenase
MAKKIDMHVPVLIVGGGGAGLTSSILLSRLGISSLLVTRYPETTRLPRGHILNQRSMEIFADMAVADEIYEKATPQKNMRGVGFYSALAGGGPEKAHGRQLGFVEAWGGGFTDPDYIAASPCASTNLSLLRSEPLLKARAEQYAGADVRLHHELVDLEQDAEGVTSTILNRDTSETYIVRSSYVLGADAGRTVAGLVGIQMGMEQRFRKLASLYLKADLSAYLKEADDAILLWIVNPEHPEHLDYGAVLVPQGPTRWGRDSEEWLMSVSRPDVDSSQPEKMLQWGREALGLPDWDAQILGVMEWHLETVLADTFRAGRVFLVGDAAHRVPPSGGLGLNSAVQDAYNLCWKLAAVLHGRAGDGLLDTYTAERRPVNENNIHAATHGAVSQAEMAPTLGVSPNKSVEENWTAVRMFFEDLPGSTERRHELNEWLGDRTVEYHQHNVDFGYTYSSSAIVSDGSAAPTPVDNVRLYQASTRPGHPLPHAWVERSGERLALRELIHDGHFALIAGEDGQAWVDAATKIAEQRNIPLRAARVGLGKVDLVDVRLAWLKQREISRDGAILVRPDGYVAYRSISAVDDAFATLTTVFTDVLHLED